VLTHLETHQKNNWYICCFPLNNFCSIELILFMKNLFCQSRVSVWIVTSLLCLSAQNRLFAPPATPTPTYYGLGGPDDFGTGAFLEFAPVPGDPGEDELSDWLIPTPDGSITPSDSTPVSGYMLSPTLIPLDQLNFNGTGSEAGNSWAVNLGGELPGTGTITESGANPEVSDGTWTAPDSSSTFTLMFFTGILLAILVPRRASRGNNT
jgi:hypothetical protein